MGEFVRICYYDDTCGKFVYIQPPNRAPLTYAYTFTIQGNTLWFLCNYGLGKLDLKTLKMTFTSVPEVYNPVYIGVIGNNTLLVTGTERMYIYNTSSNTFTTRLMLHNKAIININTSVINGNGLYVGSSAGLFLFKDAKNIDLEAKPVWDARIEDALFMPQDKQKRYLFTIVHGKGLMVFDTKLNGVAYTYNHDENNPFSILSDKLDRLHVDKSQRLWIGRLPRFCSL